MTSRILIVEDDPAQRRILEELVKRFGFESIAADGGIKGLEVLNGPNGGSIELVILDLMMPGMDGLEFIEKMQGIRGDLPVIVQTAQGSIETVIKAMRAGADDFVVKPVSPERLKISIQNLLKVNALTEEVKRLNKKVGGSLSFGDLIASSPAMANVLRLGRRGAQSNIPILIEGESGVGKEMIARAIQGESERAGRPFVAVNCGAIPENLVESILFGHEKGSFTGATSRHSGKFQEADGGTLFLDEVAELPLDMQVKLLRAIQEGEIDPVGSRKSVKVNIRLISATNRNMIEMVKAGQFREDLYYRLNVYPMMVPPLRDRKDDIPALVEHFITRLSAEEGRKVRGIAPNAIPDAAGLWLAGQRAPARKHHLPRHCPVRKRCARDPGFPPDRFACRRLRNHCAACPALDQETSCYRPCHDRWKPAHQPFRRQPGERWHGTWHSSGYRRRTYPQAGRGRGRHDPPGP